MSNPTPMNGVVLGAIPTKKNQAPMRLILVHEDGTPVAQFTRAAAQADSTASTIAGLVTDFNALLAKLRTAGIIAP